MALLPVLCLLLGYHNHYAIHRRPYTYMHVLIENTLVQHKMAKNLRMALCCQNRESKGTHRRYGLHSSASISDHSASIMCYGARLTGGGGGGEKRTITKWCFGRFQVSYLKHSNSSYKWLR